MSILNCIECNGKVSDKADICPHCGCPVNETIKQKQECLNANKEKLFYECPVCRKDYPNGMLRCDVCGYSVIYNKPQQPTQNTPKCPTCGSTNVSKIGTGERATSVIGFGLFSKKINKSYKCNNCKYTW